MSESGKKSNETGIVKLNVGGVQFVATTEVLKSSHYFSNHIELKNAAAVMNLE